MINYSNYSDSALKTMFKILKWRKRACKEDQKGWLRRWMEGMEGTVTASSWRDTYVLISEQLFR